MVAGDYPDQSIYMMQHLFNNWFLDLSLDKLAVGAVIKYCYFCRINMGILEKAGDRWMNRKSRILKMLTKTGTGSSCICFLFIRFSFFLTGSFMGQSELSENLGSVMGEATRYARWNFLPQNPTLKHYIEVLLDSPEYFVMFWNSIKVVMGTLVGQCTIAIPAAWGFAVYKFKFKKSLFFLYIIIMMMPFQVTMLSNYLILKQLKLLDTLASLIFPGIFSTFPVFIMFNFFRGIPPAVIEAARIDGAREWDIFLKIGIPLGKGGIIASLVLEFLEYWNLIEQPMTFLNDKTKWPLSLFLPAIRGENVGFAFAVSVITLIPAALVFFAGHEYLEQGIASLGIKE